MKDFYRVCFKLGNTEIWQTLEIDTESDIHDAFGTKLMVDSGFSLVGSLKIEVDTPAI
jgi:hypothetical protein